MLSLSGENRRWLVILTFSCGALVKSVDMSRRCWKASPGGAGGRRYINIPGGDSAKRPVRMRKSIREHTVVHAYDAIQGSRSSLEKRVPHSEQLSDFIWVLRFSEASSLFCGPPQRKSASSPPPQRPPRFSATSTSETYLGIAKSNTVALSYRFDVKQLAHLSSRIVKLRYSAFEPGSRLIALSQLLIRRIVCANRPPPHLMMMMTTMIRTDHAALWRSCRQHSWICIGCHDCDALGTEFRGSRRQLDVQKHLRGCVVSNTVLRSGGLTLMYVCCQKRRSGIDQCIAAARDSALLRHIFLRDWLRPCMWTTSSSKDTVDRPFAVQRPYASLCRTSVSFPKRAAAEVCRRCI